MGIISLLQIDLGILHFFNGSGNMLMDQDGGHLDIGIDVDSPVSDLVLCSNAQQRDDA